jgi:hypothetical protein
LPRESIRRELRDYCECLFRGEYDSSKISLILTSLFNAFEYSLDDVMRFLEADVFKFKIPNTDAESSFGAVMELAIVDRNNPMAWAVLAHEFGHFLDNRAGLTKRAVEEFGAKMNTTLPAEIVKALERLCKEIVADLTGYYLQGPCSIIPLANMSMLIGCIQDTPIKFDGEHGAPTTRIEMIRALSKEDGIAISNLDGLLDALVVEEGQKETQLASEEQANRTLMHGFLTGFFDVVRPVIVEELGKHQLPRFQSDNFARGLQLSNNLASGLPIGAARIHSEESARAALLATKGPDSPAIRDKYYLLEERAVSVAEVITAACIHRLQTMSELYGRAFDANTVTEAFSIIAAGHESQDRLVFKSIDMIPMLEAENASAG